MPDRIEQGVERVKPTVRCVGVRKQLCTQTTAVENEDGGGHVMGEGDVQGEGSVSP